MVEKQRVPTGCHEMVAARLVLLLGQETPGCGCCRMAGAEIKIRTVIFWQLLIQVAGGAVLG